MCLQWTGQARVVVSVLGWQMEILCWLDSLMMGGGMVFCEIVCVVGTAWLPENVKLALPDLVPDPIELQVDGLGLFLFYSVIGNANSSDVVSLEWCGWLWVAKLVQGNVHGANSLAFRTPNSASVALDMTDFMIWHRTWTGPLLGSGLSCAAGGVAGCALRKQ